MLRTTRTWIMAAALILGTTWATSAVAEPTLKGIGLGEYASGPKVSAKDLEGKVVIFEYWGVNCGPCIANIPHITELQAKYGRDKLVVIANHAQGGGAANAASVWAKHAKNDLVTVINQGNLPGADVNGIPRVFMFDHEGELVFDGHPGDLDKQVEEAVRRAPGHLVSGREFTVLKAEAAKLGKLNGNLALTLKKLRKTAEDSADPGNEEAKFLMGRVNEWAANEYKVAGEDPHADPVNTLRIITQMTKYLRGDELGEQFIQLDQKLKGDAKFQNEVKAEQMLQKVRAHAASLGLGDVEYGGKRIENAKEQVADALKTIKRRYPDTKAAGKVDALAKSLGL